MYYYVYDHFVTQKKYQPLLAKIENRLTDLEIKGKIGRLSLLNNPTELIVDEIKKGAKTIVAVGDDTTVSKVINVLAYYSDVCLGIIPIGQKLKIAQTLGLNNPIEACNALASRIIKKIDMGKIKNFYFLFQIEVQPGDLILDCDDSYRVTVDKKNKVIIYNFNYWSDNHLADPTDGLLEIMVEKIKTGFLNKISTKNDSVTFLKNKKIVIQHKNSSLEVKIDGQQTMKTPLLVEVANDKLKIIMGKNRIFA